MAAKPVAFEFDPLVELYGMWTTELAEHYLPLPNAPLVGKYECLDGYLIMSRREGSQNTYAAAELRDLLKDPHAAGCRAYLTLNVEFRLNRWIEPDLVVLKESIRRLTRVPVDKVLMPVELVSRSGRRRGRMDKPALCAEAGVPYYMRVEVDEYSAHVELLKLHGDRYALHAQALSGQLFETDLPFPLSFDPAVLLEP